MGGGSPRPNKSRPLPPLFYLASLTPTLALPRKGGGNGKRAADGLAVPPPLLDLAYLLALAAASPYLLWRRLRTGRYRRHLGAKLFGAAGPLPRGARPVWFHGVSVGEIHLLVTLVRAFRERFPGVPVVVTSTTDTGLAEAAARFGPECVRPYPLDFSWACGAAIRRLRPRLIVLAESELWPNFLAAAKGHAVPVVVVNARLSPRSFGRLVRLKGVAGRVLLRPVAHFAAQDDATAARLISLGVPPGRVSVAGSIKYDGALKPGAGAGESALGRLLGLGGAPVWVAGSTHAPEEAICLETWAKLRERVPNLVLILVPRHPDRFAEVAALCKAKGVPFVRRSELVVPLAAPPGVVLLDTVGELGAAWRVADVGFTGGSLDGVRGGQSMIEPAGYGVPVAFGPHVWNFADAAKRLVECGGAVKVADAGQLFSVLLGWLTDSAARREAGSRALALVAAQQGATARTLDVLARYLP